MQTADFSDTNLEREPLYMQVAKRIQHQMTLGIVPTGTKLPSERNLSEQFGVSRVVIREAMKVLVRDGTVAMEPGRGAFAVDRTDDALWKSFDLLRKVHGLDDESIMEVRVPLEIAVARLAAQRADPDDLAQLQACIDKMERCYTDIDLHASADERFHLGMAAATKNPLFKALMQSIVYLFAEPRRSISSMALQRGTPNLALSYNRRLLEAIRNRDATMAEAVMRSHMDQITEALSDARSLQRLHKKPGE